jgi:hypothetical protein
MSGVYHSEWDNTKYSPIMKVSAFCENISLGWKGLPGKSSSLLLWSVSDEGKNNQFYNIETRRWRGRMLATIQPEQTARKSVNLRSTTHWWTAKGDCSRWKSWKLFFNDILAKISWCVWACQDFQASIIYEGKARGKLRVRNNKRLHSGTLQPCQQILH